MAPSIATIPRPRTASGTAGVSGTCMMRVAVVTVSGATHVNVRQACRTSRARSPAEDHHARAYTAGTGISVGAPARTIAA